MNIAPPRIAIKELFYKYYWIIVLAAFTCLVTWPLVIGPADPKIMAAAIAGLLSFTFFVQKQKLEELKLFKDLFANFNAKYEQLNGLLAKITEKEGKSLEPDEVIALIDYFNLCGEEYFYFKRGYISIEVWEAWLNGMKFYYQIDPIKELWNRELEQNSYYGFSKELLD